MILPFKLAGIYVLILLFPSLSISPSYLQTLLSGSLSIIIGLLNIDISFWGGGKYDDLKNNKAYIRITNIVLGLIFILAGYVLSKK